MRRAMTPAKRAIASALSFSILLLNGGCDREKEARLILAGSTSVQPIAEHWAAAYPTKRPGVVVEVQGGGSTAGVQAALSGAASIGMSSRALTSEETKNLEPVVVARDAIVLVVHPTNTISDLTLARIRAIYRREIRDWGALGARHAPITLITREEGSGTRRAFEELALANGAIAASALVQDSTGAVRQMVASDPAAIGYISLGLVDHSVKALQLQGVAPSESTIDSGAYPLVRPFLFLVSRKKDHVTRDFIDWVVGPEGRAFTRREGLLPPPASRPGAS